MRWIFTLLLIAGCDDFSRLSDHYPPEDLAGQQDADTGGDLGPGADAVGPAVDGEIGDAAPSPSDLACEAHVSFNPSEQCSPGEAPHYTYSTSTGCLMKTCGCLHPETCTSCSLGGWMQVPSVDGGCP